MLHPLHLSFTHSLASSPSPSAFVHLSLSLSVHSPRALFLYLYLSLPLYLLIFFRYALSNILTFSGLISVRFLRIVFSQDWFFWDCSFSGSIFLMFDLPRFALPQVHSFSGSLLFGFALPRVLTFWVSLFLGFALSEFRSFLVWLFLTFAFPKSPFHWFALSLVWSLRLTLSRLRSFNDFGLYQVVSLAFTFS